MERLLKFMYSALSLTHNFQIVIEGIGGLEKLLLLYINSNKKNTYAYFYLFHRHICSKHQLSKYMHRYSYILGLNPVSVYILSKFSPLTFSFGRINVRIKS